MRLQPRDELLLDEVLRRAVGLGHRRREVGVRPAARPGAQHGGAPAHGLVAKLVDQVLQLWIVRRDATETGSERLAPTLVGALDQDLLLERRSVLAGLEVLLLLDVLEQNLGERAKVSVLLAAETDLPSLPEDGLPIPPQRQRRGCGVPLAVLVDELDVGIGDLVAVLLEVVRDRVAVVVDMLHHGRAVDLGVVDPAVRSYAGRRGIREVLREQVHHHLGGLAEGLQAKRRNPDLRRGQDDRLEPGSHLTALALEVALDQRRRKAGRRRESPRGDDEIDLLFGERGHGCSGGSMKAGRARCRAVGARRRRPLAR